MFQLESIVFLIQVSTLESEIKECAKKQGGARQERVMTRGKSKSSQVSDSNHLKIMHLTFNRQKVRMLIMCMVTWKSKQSTTRQNPKQGKLRWVYTPDKFGVRIRTALFLSFCS